MRLALYDDLGNSAGVAVSAAKHGGNGLPMNVSIIGRSGYAGGEAPSACCSIIPRSRSSRSRRSGTLASSSVQSTPTCASSPTSSFPALADLQPADVIFSALPHGVAMGQMAELRQKRRSSSTSAPTSGCAMPTTTRDGTATSTQDPELLGSFVYGIPELHRQELRDADLISSAGCMAATSILGLYPLFQAKVVDLSRPVVVEAKTGSSRSGGAPGLRSHHPERSGAMRSFKPTGHRHSAEIIQELTVDGQGPEVAFSGHRDRGGAASSPPPTSSSRIPCRRRRSGPSIGLPTRMSHSCGWSRRPPVSIATRSRLLRLQLV